MKCNSTIKLNLTKLSHLSKAQITALEQTAEALHTEVVQAQVMPFDTGNLQNESTFVDNSNSTFGMARIISATPYARRLYFHPEYDYQKWENAFAGGEWYEPWLKGGLYEDFAQEAYAKLYRRIAGL
ncbi:MAG: hypothetical protein IJZ53_07595 [Tyzzerella sp.]|nr:hypothetical protein [Tyzzerella sp.]